MGPSQRHVFVLLIYLTLQRSNAFQLPRIQVRAFVPLSLSSSSSQAIAGAAGARTQRYILSSQLSLSSSSDESDDPLLDSADQLSQFEKDLLEAFGTEDQDEAVTNAAFSAFARDLMNVDEIDDWDRWNDDTTDNEFLISQEEAFDLYTETMSDMNEYSSSSDQVNLSQFSVEVPEDEKQLVEDIVSSANKAIQSIWGEQGMSNPVRDYFKEVKKQKGNDEEDDD